MDILTFILLGLATWRTSSLLVNEAGPFDMFVKLRECAGITHVDKVPTVIPDEFFTQLLSCVWCVSVWTGTGWYLFWLALPDVAIGCASVFAFSALAIIADKCVSGAK